MGGLDYQYYCLVALLCLMVLGNKVSNVKASTPCTRTHRVVLIFKGFCGLDRELGNNAWYACVDGPQKIDM